MLRSIIFIIPPFCFCFLPFCEMLFLNHRCPMRYSKTHIKTPPTKTLLVPHAHGDGDELTSSVFFFFFFCVCCRRRRNKQLISYVGALYCCNASLLLALVARPDALVFEDLAFAHKSPTIRLSVSPLLVKIKNKKFHRFKSNAKF